MHHQDLAKQILLNIGGKPNINSVVHCATRLRFSLNNLSLANIIALKSIDGVITAIENAGQLQIVIGNDVDRVYQQIMQQIDNQSTNNPSPASAQSQPFLSTFIDLISGIFIPLLGVMTATGIIKGLLALFLACGLLSESSGTYQLLYVAADGFFFFLPLFLGYSAGKTFNTNPFLTMAIGAAMVHPLVQQQFQLFFNAELNQTTPPTMHFLGIPINYINYASSVIPIIFSAWLCAKLDKFFYRIYHKTIRSILSPVCCLLLVVPLTFLLIGPIAHYISQGLALGYSTLYNLSPILCGLVIGGLWQILVIFGLHWSTLPISYNNLAIFGQDTLLPLCLPAVMCQSAACFAIMCKSKDRPTKSMSLAASISGIFGVTEPAIYGVTLPRKIPFIFGCIGGAIGGAIVGYYEPSSYSIGLLTIFTLMQIIPKTGIYLPVFGAVAACLIGALSTFILTLLFYKEETFLAKSQHNSADLASSSQSDLKQSAKNISPSTQVDILKSPLAGEIIPIEQVPDVTFATELMGQSIAIEPTNQQLLSPCHATISSIAVSKHAISLISSLGVEILIHIGIDTVMLAGEPYTVHVEVGQQVSEGERLISFDLEKIKQANLSPITVIIITNSDEYQRLFTAPVGKIQLMEHLMTLSNN